jgi:hypothetical protein
MDWTKIELGRHKSIILRVRVMVFNVTFNNISVILWQSVLLVEETGVPEKTGVPRKNHQSVSNH